MENEDFGRGDYVRDDQYQGGLLGWMVWALRALLTQSVTEHKGSHTQLGSLDNGAPDALALCCF